MCRADLVSSWYELCPLWDDAFYVGSIACGHSSDCRICVLPGTSCSISTMGCTTLCERSGRPTATMYGCASESGVAGFPLLAMQLVPLKGRAVAVHVCQPVTVTHTATVAALKRSHASSLSFSSSGRCCSYARTCVRDLVGQMTPHSLADT